MFGAVVRCRTRRASPRCTGYPAQVPPPAWPASTSSHSLVCVLVTICVLRGFFPTIIIEFLITLLFAWRDIVTDRRHHCRNCGKVFCSKCSDHEIPIPSLNITKPARVCDGCFALLSAQEPGSLASPLFPITGYVAPLAASSTSNAQRSVNVFNETRADPLLDELAD